ncbi:MAG TPA: pyridoxamine 5'-phosphate oxidase family protein [Candidatus Eisenbacteria bacterium]|nr:pyridoxamine 5'-phosphate oxidase family protein [Candidatus Eisenbacteria bacterium]
MVILEKIRSLLRDRSFISLATANLKCEPHAVPKFLLKIQDGCVYLVDYAIARTVENLRSNPRACLSFMDLRDLEGYRMSGSVTLVEEGPEHAALLKEFEKRLIRMSATRLIEGMKSGKPNEHYELEIPNRVLVIKVKIEEVVKVGRQGELFSEKA